MKKLLFGASLCATVLFAASCTEKAPEKGSGINYAIMDTTVNPGEDFAKYAAGNWTQVSPKPADQPNWTAFTYIEDKNSKLIGELIQGIAAQQNEPGSLKQKVADVYNMVMDSVRLNNEGLEPVKPYLEKINALESNAALISYAAQNHDNILFGVRVGADAKDARVNIVSVGQGGLTLGDRNYYLSDEAGTKKVRDAYVQHIINSYMLLGLDEAAAKAKMETVMKVETEMAKNSKDRLSMRDPEANYHKMTVAELNKLTPGFDWDQYLKEFGYDQTSELNVSQVEPVQFACQLLAKGNLNDLKTLYEWQTLNGALDYMSDACVTENFNFNASRNGAAAQEARWKRALGIENRLLSWVVGQLYVEKYFPAENKARMEELCKNLIASFGDRIMAQEWMSEETKKVALEKLNSFYVKVGYPNKWDDYSPLTIDPAKSLYENALAAQEFRFQLNKEKNYNKPVNKDDWWMTPQTVNASYSPSQNSINFPAAILQPPFFNMEADDAVNYGAIGVVIGHEMTHGFDDSGRQYDKDGNLHQWWSDEDVEAFKIPAEQLALFYDQTEPLPGLHTNGHLTLGENLSDHGGLMIAFNALQKILAETPLPVENGFTPEQRFFLSYGTVWESDLSEEYIRARTLSNPHSTSYIRVNAALPHIDAWYEAFGIKEGDKLYVAPEERVRIW